MWPAHPQLKSVQEKSSLKEHPPAQSKLKKQNQWATGYKILGDWVHAWVTWYKCIPGFPLGWYKRDLYIETGYTSVGVWVHILG